MPLTIKAPQRPSLSSESPFNPSSSSSRRSPSIVEVGSARSSSPVAPPGSPLTPVVRPAVLAHTDGPSVLPHPSRHARHGQPNSVTPRYAPVEYIEQPPSLPFSGEDASDAIALRAAISSLQFQRKRAQDDLRALEQIKQQAVRRPEEFQRHILGIGTASKGPKKYTVPDYDPSDDIADDADEAVGASSADKESKGHSKIQHLATGEVPDSQASPGLLSSFGSAPATQGYTQQEYIFPPIPQPQDVVRCPPVNWAKFNIVGESLDRLHRQQQARPDDGFGQRSTRDSTISAPYDPLHDRLHSTQVDSGGLGSGRKDSGASAAEQALQLRRSNKFTS